MNGLPGRKAGRGLTALAAMALAWIGSAAGAIAPAFGAGNGDDDAGAGGAVRVLTLEDALGIAAERNRDIQKAREFRSLVQGRYVAERAVALPHLTILSGISRESDESQKAFGGGAFPGGLFPIERDFRNAEIGLSQVLFAWGQVGAAIQAAKVGLDLADDELNLFRQAVTRDVSASFYDVLLARGLQAITTQNLEQKERHLDEARRKLAAGVATDYDVLAAEVEVENARPDVIRARNQAEMTREKLRFLLGGGEEGIDVQGSLEAPIDPPPGYEAALAAARESRPELAQLDHRIGIAGQLVTVANGGDKPHLDFQGSYGWRQLVFGDSEANGQAWSAGVNLSFPVFDGLKSRGETARARSELATLEIERAKLKEAVALEVREAVNAVREAGEIVKALGGTVSQAERLVTMAEQGYELGVKTRLDVDDAQVNLTFARAGLARAQHDYLVARVTLRWVTGAL